MRRIVTLAVLLACVAAAQPQDLTAIVVDVTGSMRDHDFPAIQEQVCGRVATLGPGTVIFVIPFAEDALDVFRVALNPDSFEAQVAEAQQYIMGLRAGGSKRGFDYGDHTNIDEGVDAAVLALAGEQSEGRKQVLLISDGISQPDTYHKPVVLEDLAQKAKKLGVELTMLDVSGTPVPQVEPELHNGFKIYRFPTPNLRVITMDSPGQWQLVWPVLDSIRQSPVSEPPPRSARWWLVPLAAGFLAAAAWLILRRKAKPPVDAAGRRLLCISVNRAREEQYGLPQVVSVGGDPDDTLKIPSARPKELILTATEEGVCRFRFKKADRDENGVVYGNREFTLSCGAPVAVRVDTQKTMHQTNHRYFR